MVALQTSPKIESLYGLGRQPKKLGVSMSKWMLASELEKKYGQYDLK